MPTPNLEAPPHSRSHRAVRSPAGAQVRPAEYVGGVNEMGGRQTPGLLGRAAERRTIDSLLSSVRGGKSAVLVIRGEAGIGKTALLQDCARQATGLRVERMAGAATEAELPFAALHQFCLPMLERFDAIPGPQRDALGVALGLSAGEMPDRLRVGLAVLSLLSANAEGRPLIWLVEDAQWLDTVSAQVLAFVSRLLSTEPVGVVFAVREPYALRHFDELPELALSGLEVAAAEALLSRTVAGRLSDDVRDRLVTETRGNPLALLKLPLSMSAAELAGGFQLSAVCDLPGHKQEHYARRVAALPEPTQRLMLLASADPAGDPPLVWRAAQVLGIEVGALAPATDAGLLDIGSEVRFRHPLVRSAVYAAASTVDRQLVHAALAQVSDPETEADRRAWHRALATREPDEEVAAALERSAHRAQVRNGFATAGALLQKATTLTVDAGLKARRALAAAELSQGAGATEAALTLLDQADAGPLSDLDRARARVVRARAAFGSGCRRDVPALLLAAARELEPLDPSSARDTYLEALSAAQCLGHRGDVSVRDVAEVAILASAASSRPEDQLLDGLAIVLTDGYAAGAAALRRAVDRLRGASLHAVGSIHWMWLATHAAQGLWDDALWEVLSERHLAMAREAGALAVLPVALGARIGLHLFAGELSAASALVDEASSVARAAGVGLPLHVRLGLAAYRGQQEEASKLIRAFRAEAELGGDGTDSTLVNHAEAVLNNGLGRYPEACAAAQRGAAEVHDLGVSIWSLPELIEAAVRSDRRPIAEAALRELTRSTRAAATDWALGVEARCRALLSTPDAAEPLYREAIERLNRTRVHAERARAHLLFGEWLRRERRRVDAREHLRAAQQLYGEMRMEAFAERARRELHATGETVRKRVFETQDELTPQERQIARLAEEGLSNPEIGVRLFLSPRTVEWHLRKVFIKLDIKSRRGLHAALSGADAEPTHG